MRCSATMICPEQADQAETDGDEDEETPQRHGLSNPTPTAGVPIPASAAELAARLRKEAAIRLARQPAASCHASPVREKELRLALICYGGISLAVYMHGITKEVWRLARASRAFHAGEAAAPAARRSIARLIEAIARECELDVRVLVDILAGASAGGINAIFLAEAIASGRSLDPLTELWLETADVDRLIDPAVSRGVAHSPRRRRCRSPGPGRRGAARSSKTVEPEHREEITRQARQFRPRPLVRAAVQRRRLHPPAARRVRRDGDGPAGRAAAARLPSARPVRHRHRLLRLFRAASAQLAGRGDRAASIG